MFCKGVLPISANWRIWAKEKAIRFGTALNYRIEMAIGLYPYTLQEIF
jgi:hypothetical protein